MVQSSIVLIKKQVIAPTLRRIGLYSDSALNLVAGTGLVESSYTHRKQLGNGPAQGYWQMEPVTENDCWDHFLDYRPALAAAIRALVVGPLTPTAMRDNDEYAAAMCRVKYLRAPAALPVATDPEALCKYWKLYYNTPLGKGKVDTRTIGLFRIAIGA